MFNDLNWYPRFGDIPGISYPVPSDLDVASLPGYGATPEVHRYESGASLWWGDTSESPAWAHARFDRLSAGADWLVQRLQETLELPGTASDYHFALTGAAEALRGRRYLEPPAMSETERLWLLDIELIEARPDAFIYERSDGTSDYYGFASLSGLASLYSVEGYLREALALTEKAERFGQLRGEKEKLLARLAVIEAEDDE
jgi:hypothetical protein